MQKSMSYSYLEQIKKPSRLNDSSTIKIEESQFLQSITKNSS
jgi:hypothetical protein